jgi:excisionase family DNA binding protein
LKRKGKHIKTDSVAPGDRSLPTVIIPRMLRIPDVARYLSATNWFVEELIRNRKLRFRILGKRRVVDIQDLDDWIEAEKQREGLKELTNEQAQQFFQGVEKDEDGNYIVSIRGEDDL